MGLELNEISKNALGGTELMIGRLGRIDKGLLDQFQIISSRVRELDKTKHRILICHDLADDPEADHLANRGWSRFHRIVFVSYTQRDAYIRKFAIPYSKTVVMRNAIDPIGDHEKPTDKINLIYHTTPHRGLELLVPVFQKLAESHKNIHLDVYSSFSIYGWEERDEPYRGVFEAVEAHPQMTYHGAVSNEKVREALRKAHIFAYPSIWQETSCLALIEALSAGCICVHSDYGALPETSSGFSAMYGYDENPNRHASVFYSVLNSVIKTHTKSDRSSQVMYMNAFYAWDQRQKEWEALLKSVLAEPLELDEDEKEMFVFNTAS